MYYLLFIYIERFFRPARYFFKVCFSVERAILAGQIALVVESLRYTHFKFLNASHRSIFLCSLFIFLALQASQVDDIPLDHTKITMKTSFILSLILQVAASKELRRRTQIGGGLGGIVDAVGQAVDQVEEATGVDVTGEVNNLVEQAENATGVDLSGQVETVVQQNENTTIYEVANEVATVAAENDINVDRFENATGIDTEAVAGQVAENVATAVETAENATGVTAEDAVATVGEAVDTAQNMTVDDITEQVGEIQEQVEQEIANQMIGDDTTATTTDSETTVETIEPTDTEVEEPEPEPETLPAEEPVELPPAEEGSADDASPASINISVRGIMTGLGAIFVLSALSM